ncbi:MAG TPA: hypothetical protein PK639_01780 [Candidatus Woesebacteria bacterium]|nr:hypothetical protein [Candidatus Woesebacteria bacterium]
MTLKVEHGNKVTIFETGNYYSIAEDQINGLTLDKSSSVTVLNPLRIRGLDGVAVAGINGTYALVHHGQGVEVTLKNGEVYRLIHQ